MLRHMIMFSFVKNCLSSRVNIPYHFVVRNGTYCCSTSSSAFGGVSVPDFGHSNWCVVVPHYFNLHFLMTYAVEHLFMCLLAIFISSLVRCLLRSLTHFLNQVVCFLLLSLRVLCMFWVTVLYCTYLLQIFSPSLWLIFEFS